MQRWIISSTLLSAILLIAGMVLYAQWIDDGIPICTESGNQFYPRLISDGAGGAIIVWDDLRGGDYDVYAQAVDADGHVRWTLNGLPIGTGTGAQGSARIVSDNAGGAFITWYDSGDIYAQRVSAGGTIQWTPNGVAVCAASGAQSAPDIVSNGARGAIIAWMDLRGGDYDIYAQYIDANGIAQWTTDGVAVREASYNQIEPKLAPDGAGGAVIVWEDDPDYSSDIYAQRIDSVGVIQWASSGVTICTASGRQEENRIATDGFGGAIITWEDARGGTEKVYAQRVSAGGTVQWAANGIAVCLALGAQYLPQIAPLGGGESIVTWEDNRNSSQDIFAQKISSAGALLWTSNGAAVCIASQNQLYPKIASNSSGEAVFTWRDLRDDADDIYTQKLDANGRVMWGIFGQLVCGAADGQHDPEIVSDGDGGAFIAWCDYRPSIGTDIYAQRVYQDGYSGVLRPEVVATSPQRNELDVSTAADITATFDLDMNAATINSSTFVATGHFTGYRSGIISYFGGAKTAALYPDANFHVGEIVTATLTIGIESMTGAHLATGYSWSFTVEAEDAPGAFGPCAFYAAGDGSRSVCGGDLDDDGDIDLATADVNSDSVSILLNMGGGVFASSISYSVAHSPYIVRAGDLDGDGDLDLVTANLNYNEISVVLNDGNGSFSGLETYNTDTAPFDVFPADLDGDGDLDLTVASYYSATVTIFLNDDGVFDLDADYATGANPRAVLVADLDGDNDLDIATANYFPDSVTVLLNNGSGEFFTRADYAAGDGAVSIAASDLDGDGDLDLVTVNYYDNDLSVLLNTGSAVFLPPVKYSAGVRPFTVTTADIEGDGDQDLMIANSISDYISVLLNNGNGTFAPHVTYAAGDNPYSVFPADLDGDGDIDCAAANRDSDNVSVFLNLNAKSVTMPVATAGVDIFFVSDSDTLAVMNFASEALDSVTVSAYIGELPPNILLGSYWILRHFDITPYPADAIFEADLTLFYEQEEFDSSGLAYESELGLYRYNDVDSLWEFQGCVLDTIGNSVTCSGIDKFSLWALTDSKNAVAVPDFVGIPTAALYQNYPNPFNPHTRIEYAVHRNCHVRLSIYNVQGQRVVTLIDERQEAGYKSLHWNGTNQHGLRVASGIYFYQLRAGDYIETRKMILLR